MSYALGPFLQRWRAVSVDPKLAIVCLALAGACGKTAGEARGPGVSGANGGGTDGGGGASGGGAGGGGSNGGGATGGGATGSGGAAAAGNIDGGPTTVTVDAGTPTTLATGAADGPWDIKVDASFVYWTDAKAKTVMKVAKQGGAPMTLASSQDGVSTLAIDATSVYWIDGLASDLGSVMKVPLAGGTPVAIASEQYAPNSVVVDVMNVYWTTAGNYVLKPAGTVMKASLATGEITALNSNQAAPGSIFVDATRAYWAIGPGEGGGGAVWSVPLSGGAPTEVVFVAPPSQINAVSIAVDAANVYWSEYGTPSAAGPGPAMLKKQPITGGSAITLLTGNVAAFVLDGGSIYVAMRKDRAIVRVSVDGTTVVSIPTGEQPYRLAVDQTRIYFTTAEGSILSIAKP